MGEESFRLKESATFMKILLCVELWEYDRSQLLFLILKSLVIMKTLLILISISLRYFKAV